MDHRAPFATKLAGELAPASPNPLPPSPPAGELPITEKSPPKPAAPFFLSSPPFHLLHHRLLHREPSPEPPLHRAKPPSASSSPRRSSPCARPSHRAPSPSTVQAPASSQPSAGLFFSQHCSPPPSECLLALPHELPSSPNRCCSSPLRRACCAIARAPHCRACHRRATVHPPPAAIPCSHREAAAVSRRPERSPSFHLARCRAPPLSLLLLSIRRPVSLAATHHHAIVQATSSSSPLHRAPPPSKLSSPTSSAPLPPLTVEDRRLLPPLLHRVFSMSCCASHGPVQ